MLKYNNNTNKVFISSVILVMLVMITLSGCGNIPDSNGSVKAEDGRSYGGLVESELGETVHTVFFDLTVNMARKCGTYQFQDGLYIADAGQTYLEVLVTITNTYDKDLPMSISDFTLDFSENESETAVTGFGSTELSNNDYMDNIYTLKKGESITKTILYTVPDRAEYLLCYKEYYEDKFEGDSYEIKMIPEVLEPAVTTEDASSAVNEEAASEADDNGVSTPDDSVEGSSGTEGDTGSADDTENSDNSDGVDSGDTGIIEQ